jgi:murein DD-endopeptidase MepM/ murein hydrolase activator NlpD
MRTSFGTLGRLGVTLALAGIAIAEPALSAPADPPAAADPSLLLATFERNLADLDVRERSEAAELARVGAQVAQVHERVVEHGRAYYRLTRAGLLPVGGGFEALVTHAMHVERARRVVTRDLRDEAALHTRADELGRDLERLRRDRSALTSQRDATRAAQAVIEDEMRRQAAFDQAFKTSTGAAADYVAVSGGGGWGGAGASPDLPAGGFASARGRLLFPVIARADVRAARRDGAHDPNRAAADVPGLEIRAPAGAAVRAVFAARVAFADRYGPYGRIVILDHGDHYYTVSGNLGSIEVKIGQDVAAGDRIGTVGDDGSGALLYFEVRHGSQAVPPAPWLGL